MSEYDFSYVWPSAEELIAAGATGVRIYLGRARPPFEVVAAWAAAGLTIRWIFETNQTRAYDGYAAGWLDGSWSDERADEVWPAGEMIVNLGDTPNIAGHESAVSEYSRGFCEANRRVEMEGYGPLGALQAGRRGHRKLTRWWGVETWIPGSNNDPVHNVALWADAGADVVQMANVGSSIAGTDLDVIINPNYPTGGSAPAPLPPPPEEPMLSLIRRATDGPAGGDIPGNQTAGHTELVDGFGGRWWEEGYDAAPGVQAVSNVVWSEVQADACTRRDQLAAAATSSGSGPPPAPAGATPAQTAAVHSFTDSVSTALADLAAAFPA